jgi:micrococcal nuclease
LVDGSGGRAVYEYRASVIRILDGDTVELDVDLGCWVHVHRICRLLGINAPEVKGATLAEGIRTKRRLEQLVLGWGLRVRTQIDKGDKYGRLLVTIWRVDEDPSARSVNDTLLAEGLAEVMKQ